MLRLVTGLSVLLVVLAAAGAAMLYSGAGDTGARLEAGTDGEPPAALTLSEPGSGVQDRAGHPLAAPVAASAVAPALSLEQPAAAVAATAPAPIPATLPSPTVGTETGALPDPGSAREPTATPSATPIEVIVPPVKRVTPKTPPSTEPTGKGAKKRKSAAKDGKTPEK